MTDVRGAAEPQRLRGRSFAETRSAVLDLIRAEGEISRAELSKRSALTEKTISGVVKSLLAAGVVVEAGFAKSTGGKRPVLLRLNDKELYAIGVTLDVARCIIVVCAPDGRELARSELRGTGTDDPAAVLKRLAAAMLRLLQRRSIDRAAVVGVCVAMGGRRSAPGGWRVDSAFADLWEPFATESELTKITGLPVIRENDANCAALGEYWTGGSATRDFATVYLSHGIGAGIIIGGTVYRGASGNAGEIGHTVADPHGDLCWCGRRGCLDTVASPRAVTERILASPALRRACGVGKDTEFGEVYRCFGSTALNGEPRARELLDSMTGHLAAAVGDLVNTLDLNEISLAGPGFAGIGDHLRDALDDYLNRLAFMRDIHSLTVKQWVAGPDAAALGAASVVLHRELTPHHVGNAF